MKIDVSSTNDTKLSKSYVRVYVDGVMAAEVSPPKRNPLRYMRQHPKSKYWGKVWNQLVAAGHDYGVRTEVMHKMKEGD